MVSYPGEGTLYRDVGDVVLRASEEMHVGDYIAMSNITMFDAMNAIKIGDSRMDSGYRDPGHDETNSFDVHARLLPEEVCWLLDQTFSAEIAWHQGTTLTQTVFQLLHIHDLCNYASWYGTSPDVPEKPAALVGLVLAAGVLGMAKSCELAWRELAKGCVYEHEDWQADKAGVLMAEHVSVNEVLLLLNRAIQWTQTYEGLNAQQRHSLFSRLQLRKLWLGALALNLPADYSVLSVRLPDVQQALRLVREDESPSPSASSPARLAVDPNIKRLLKFTTPLQPTPLPSVTETWPALEQFVDGLARVCRLCSVRSPFSWQNMLLLASRGPPTPKYCAYVRAVMNFSIFDGVSVMGDQDPDWLVEIVMLELADVPPSGIQGLSDAAASAGVSAELEQCLSKFADLLLNFFTTLCHNRPRQRRMFSNALTVWRELFLSITNFIPLFELAVPDLAAEMETLQRLRLAIDYYRCLIALEVIFSGFELELYGISEWFCVLRFAVAVLRRQTSVLDALARKISASEGPALSCVRAQMHLNGALSNTCFGILMGVVTDDRMDHLLSDERQLQNAERRFKWALPDSADDFQPDWSANARWMSEQARLDPLALLAEGTRWLTSAQTAALNIIDHATEVPYLELCRSEHRQFVANIVKACQKTVSFWKKALDGSGPSAPHRRIDWTNNAHPWFLTPHAPEEV